MLLLRDLSVLWSLLHILVLFMMLYRSRYYHVYRQTCNVSIVGICGSSLHQETIYGASGGSAKRMGDFCGHDVALLYPACYYGEFSSDDHQ